MTAGLAHAAGFKTEIHLYTDVLECNQQDYEEAANHQAISLSAIT